MTVRVFLAALAAMSLAACNDPSGDAIGDGGPATDHDRTGTGEAVPAPLPEDGMAPVVAVTGAWIRPHPQGRDVTAAYFTAMLANGSTDRLTGARIDGAERIELHGHTMNEQGMMQMRPVGPQDIAPGDSLAFAPGGLHLMVFGLAPVAAGDMVEGVLEFERAGDVPVRFEARNSPPSADGSSD